MPACGARSPWGRACGWLAHTGRVGGGKKGVGKTAFLYIGPGAKGEGFKAMFKLTSSLETARKLATEEPDRFDVGTTGWVTARFTAEEPMPEKLWKSWLDESYESALASKAGAKKAARKKK